jgi:sugar-specific transcriptional regulator TrmB
MIEQFLENIGLSQKEAVVYMALLAVESSSVMELAKKTEIKRTSIYPIIESLEKKGLVSEVEVGKKNEYRAEAPERLETYIKNEQIKLDEQAKLLTEIVPRLKSVSRDQGERPIIKYYDGREGIIDSISTYLGDSTEGGDLFMVYPKDILDETFTEAELKRARTSRLSKHIKTHSLYSYSKGDLPSEEISERVRLTDTEEFPILCDIAVYEDRVRIHTLGKKLSAIHIKNHDLAETLKTLIRLAISNVKNKAS